MAGLLRYGAYLPRPRAPLGEIQSFYGRPGRPRARALATPALDEDALTMGFEAAREALGGERAPRAIVSVTQSPPFGLRKVSATLARALDLAEDTVHYDLAGHAGSLLDGIELASVLAEGDGERPVLVVASDHLVSYEDRVCDMLSAGGAAAFLVGAGDGFCRLGPLERATREVYDVWRLGTEPEPRYRLEVLFDTYAATAREALGALSHVTERDVALYTAVCASQPHPQTLRSLGRAGATEKQLAETSFVSEIGNLGAASVGVAMALGLDRARRGQRLVAFGYGAGEGIAQELEVVAKPPAIGTAGRIPGDPITIGTYYRWTRGRQQEPH